jgi:hypothetical protein
VRDIARGPIGWVNRTHLGHHLRQSAMKNAARRRLTGRIGSRRAEACRLLMSRLVGRGSKCHGGAFVLPTPGEEAVSAFPSPDSLATMVNSVTTTMMNVKFALAGSSAGRAAFRRAVLPIPGTHPVSVALACDEGSCRQLGAKLFCVKPGEVDVSMIEDTLRELANITAGQVKRAMSLDQALGLPQILPGTESWGTQIAGSQLVLLKAEAGDIEIELQIARHEKAS